MNVIDTLKKKYKRQTGKKQQVFGERKQFNTTINPGMIRKIKRMAAEFAVPGYAIVEHMLETGHFYVFKITKNQRKREILRAHLIDEHMLGVGYCPEEILRIGEGRYASEMISMTEDIIRDYKLLERVWEEAKKTGNIDNVEKARKKIMRKTLAFAHWLSSHSLEESESKEVLESEEEDIEDE